VIYQIRLSELYQISNPRNHFSPRRRWVLN
jgi:hypothetical protein